jgi:DNA-binding NtrC family response regulator
VRRGVAEGQYAFLAKPFSAQQLMMAIQSVLTTAPGVGVIAAGTPRPERPRRSPAPAGPG